MKHYKCDRCSKEIPSRVFPSYHDGYTVSVFPYSSGELAEDKHICEDCHNSYQLWLVGGLIENL